MTTVVRPHTASGGAFGHRLPPITAASVEHVAMLALLTFWAVPATGAYGGRGVHTELVFAVFLVPVLLLVRAWRAPWRSAALAAVVAVAALLVCVWAPSGWYGGDAAAGYGLSAAVFVATRRYVRSGNRRMLVVVGICLACIYQFSRAFTPWWGGGDPAAEMTGTFYGHNAYAAFLLPGALLGLGVVAQLRGPWSTAGWVAVPLCTAGIVYSSSRATFAALVAGAVVMLVLSTRNRAAAIRVAAVLAISAALTLVLPGPPLFSHHASPFAATDERAAAGESLEQNGHYRTEFWRGAVQVLAHRPAVGGGYHSLATASALYTPSGWARSPNAHDGYLQALSDGGLLLGVPFLAAVLVAVGWSLRRLWVLISRHTRAAAADFVLIAGAVALLGAFAHSAVDADWTYPAIMIESALVLACVAPARTAAAPGGTHSSRRAAAVGASSVVALAGVLGVSTVALHQWQLSGSSQYRSPAALLAAGQAAFGDFRPIDRLLRGVVDGQVTIDRREAAQALAMTKDEAAIDLHLALRRFAVGAATGLIPDAAAQARELLQQVSGGSAPYVLDLATVELAAGERSAARTVLANDIAAQARARTATPLAPAELDLWAKAFGTGAQYACQLDRLSGLTGAPQPGQFPAATADCPGS